MPDSTKVVSNTAPPLDAVEGERPDLWGLQPHAAGPEKKFDILRSFEKSLELPWGTGSWDRLGGLLGVSWDCFGSVF